MAGPLPDARSLVLHGLRLGGLLETGVLAERLSLVPAAVEADLRAAIESGLARRLDGRASGWMLTAAGRAEDDRLLAAELDAAGLRPQVDASYRRFLTVNAELLATCTAWQVRDGTEEVNDHADAAYDASVIDRLSAIDAVAQPVCADLAAALGRFAPYGPRLANALARVQRGEVDWFTNPRLDSYHSVWFELHEDQLATLGIERSSEGA